MSALPRSLVDGGHGVGRWIGLSVKACFARISEGLGVVYRYLGVGSRHFGMV